MTVTLSHEHREVLKIVESVEPVSTKEIALQSKGLSYSRTVSVLRFLRTHDFVECESEGSKKVYHLPND